MKSKGRGPVQARAICRRDSKGRVLKGSSLGGSRKGSPNRATLAGRELLAHLERGDASLLLPPCIERLAALLTDPDPAIRLGFEKFLYEALYVRATQALDVKSDAVIKIVNTAWRPSPHVNETVE